MRIPDEYIKAAETAYAKPSIRINRRLGDRWKPGPGDVLLEKLRVFLRESAAQIGDIPFALRLHQHKEEVASPLSVTHLTGSTTGELVLFDIDETLSVFNSDPVGVADSGAEVPYLLQELSEQDPILHYVNKGFARIFAGGIIDEFNPSTGGPAGTTHHYKRPAAEYESMIREHYEHDVKHAERCKHWEIQADRRLFKKTPGASKTEHIFQNSLEEWLRDYIADRAEVRVELRTESEDRTDIEIYPLVGGYFIIEIKWMGTNGTTSYGEERIVKGLQQITNYLSTGNTVRRATLVAYDARNESAFASLSNAESIADGIKQLTEGVPPRGSALILFLFNKHASDN